MISSYVFSSTEKRKLITRVCARCGLRHRTILGELSCENRTVYDGCDDLMSDDRASHAMSGIFLYEGCAGQK